MKIVEVTMESTAPYSQSKQHTAPKLDRETHEDYDRRTWREKCTTSDDGVICIPAMALKQCLDTTAKRLGLQIPGKGKSTYTKHFKSGVICEANVPLGVKKDEVGGDTISVNADGVRGSGKRVYRTFPLIPSWSAKATFAIFDDTVTKPIFERHMVEAGRFVGIGRFRPENGGLYGRFKPVEFKWSEIG
jgi:hypothetical protein